MSKSSPFLRPGRGPSHEWKQAKRDSSTAQADAFVPQNHPGRKKRAGANAEEKTSACSAPREGRGRQNDKFSFFGSVRGTVETVPSLWRAARLGVGVTQKSKADS